MRIWQDEKTSGNATWFRFILLGLISLLLLPSTTYPQSDRQVSFRNSLAEPAHFEKSDLLPDRSELTEHPPTGLIATSLGELSASHWWQSNLRSPLPPASVFAIQTNLRKYLDTRPTWEATTSSGEPPDEQLTDADLM